MLELRKCLKGVDKARLLSLLKVPHYNHTPITWLVIKQLLFLVHDGCLWMEEMIPITDRLIHKITRLPYIGENPPMMFGINGGELTLTEVMKEKFKPMKKLWGYAISSIYDPTVKVATFIWAGKDMKKCCKDEVSTPIIALASPMCRRSSV